MTTVVDALDRVARLVSVDEPSDWTTATATEHVEIRDDFLLQAVDDITDRVDWSDPIGTTLSFVGDGSGRYVLPTKFKRLQRDAAAIYDPANDRPAIPIPKDSEWSAIVDFGASGADTYYQVRGYEGNYSLYTFPAQEADETLTMHYMSDIWMINGVTYGSAFTALADVLVLPRRLVEAGIIYRWRERKGLPFLDVYQEYERLLARYQNDNRGNRRIQFGQSIQRSPFDIPLPNIIPSS